MSSEGRHMVRLCALMACVSMAPLMACGDAGEEGLVMEDPIASSGQDLWWMEREVETSRPLHAASVVRFTPGEGAGYLLLLVLTLLGMSLMGNVFDILRALPICLLSVHVLYQV